MWYFSFLVYGDLKEIVYNFIKSLSNFITIMAFKVQLWRSGQGV